MIPVRPLLVNSVTRYGPSVFDHSCVATATRLHQLDLLKKLDLVFVTTSKQKTKQSGIPIQRMCRKIHISCFLCYHLKYSYLPDGERNTSRSVGGLLKVKINTNPPPHTHTSLWPELWTSTSNRVVFDVSNDASRCCFQGDYCIHESNMDAYHK